MGMLEEAEWVTRKNRIATRLRALTPPWAIIRYRDGLNQFLRTNLAITTNFQPTMKTKNTMKSLLLAVIAGSVLVGCVANRNSNHVNGEVVLQLNPYPQGRHAIEAEAAGALAGIAVDLVKAQIEAEAQKLERQFGQVDYKPDFWSVQFTNGVPKLKQNYEGFTLRRLTKDYPTAGNPAMQFDCSFLPSVNGRVFIIEPTRFVLRQAKAKVVNSDNRVDVTINIAMDAMWIDKSQVAHQERIAISSFDILNYDLSKTNVLTNFKGQSAGWFPGIPISAGLDGKYSWESGAAVGTNSYSDGCFKLTVLVTEKDSSKAKVNLEKTAKFIGDQKQTLVNQMKSEFK
jgi:hypothetical protein